MAGRSGSGSRSLDKKSIMRRGAKKSSGGGGGRSDDGAKKQKPGDDDKMNNIHQKKQKATTTLEELIDAVSDEEDDDDADDDNDAGDDDADDGDGGDGEDENRAQALRKLIRDGKFDELLKSKTPKDEDEDVEEDDVEEEDDDEDEDGDGEQEEEDDDDDEQEEDEAQQYDRSPTHERKYDEDDDDDSSSNEDNNEQQRKNDTSNTTSVRSLALHTSSLSSDRHLPWPESFAVTAVTPLPFKSVAVTVPSTNNKVVAGEEGIYEEEMDAGGGGVDVHDDLAREVAFYDAALECTTLAREQCDKFGIPFARPEDFFAEMVKSDGE
jgi:rRNA-processing protein EBP2